ncbi:4-hydroxyphenylacetate 3-hydroxylase N-terminal domain-containing protein [Chloroflexota bacterium]
MLSTSKAYKERLSKLRPKIYIGGQRVQDILDHPVARTVVEANATVYDMALDPRYRDVMTADSPLVGDKINRSLHICGSTNDLEMRAAMARLTSQKLGTCNYRCPGCEVLNGLASITWEMDRDLGAEYHHRLMEFAKYLQNNDLAMSGAITDVKGDRSKRPMNQDPDTFVHIVERCSDGIVVKGAKQHQSGAYVSDWTMVLPTQAYREGEEDLAVAFAVPNGTEGMTYIGQFNAYSAERMQAQDSFELGSPVYGQRETSLIIFDNVFVPWDKVFLCGEVKYTGTAVARFAKVHRVNCGGACKVGFADLIIGATRLMAEYLGTENTSTIVDKLTQMIQQRETWYACAIAATHKGKEEPEGSGVFVPDDTYSNVAKLNTSRGFWELLALAGDIVGGFVVTMPSERDLKNPETKEYLEKYLRVKVPAEERMRIARFLQHWVAGLHGAATWHGAGSPQAQKMTLYRLFDFEEKKKMARELAGLPEPS